MSKEGLIYEVFTYLDRYPNGTWGRRLEALESLFLLWERNFREKNLILRE